MLPKANRLNIRTYYSEIRGNGRKLSNPLFSFYYRVQPGEATPKINVIISKKIAKSAVARNRMRRLIHTAVQNLLPKFKLGLEGLFFVHSDFSQRPLDEITNIVNQIMSQGKLKND